MKVMTGEKNADDDGDAYIKELNDAHYGEYLAELEKVEPLVDIISGN